MPEPSLLGYYIFIRLCLSVKSKCICGPLDTSKQAHYKCTTTVKVKVYKSTNICSLVQQTVYHSNNNNNSLYNLYSLKMQLKSRKNAPFDYSL
jgi:hypothetical protein